MAKDFFRTLSSFRNISYIAVGTYCIVDLLTSDGSTFVSPFNKAKFLPMPLFEYHEMGEIFELYKRHINPEGIPLDVKTKIVQESNGYPDSFMLLLKLFDEHRPDSTSWGTVLQQHLEGYLNGTHTKIKKWLQKLKVQVRNQVRELTTNAADPWDVNLDDLDPNSIDKKLLDIGVIVPTTTTSVRFTSYVILRVCINVLWPKPNNRLRVEDLVPFNPINLLKYGLSHVSPAILQHPLVRNKHGPAEKGFQAALYSVFNGLLPKPMGCLFEPWAKDRDQLDLIVVSGNKKLAGYELKVSNITQADLIKSLDQA